MPFTLFHYPIGYGLSKLNDRLSLPALVVGSVIPDIEVPFLFLFFQGVLPDHFILHSLIGALTIGLLLAVLVVRYVYPPVVGFVFNLDRSELLENCRITPLIVISAAIGILSHILIDIPFHWYNQILWPWVDAQMIVGPVCILFAWFLETDIMSGYYAANQFTNGVMAIVLALIIIRTKENRWHRLWIGN